MSAHDLLTQGLQAGFGGNTQMSKVNRGGIELTASHHESELGTYHDEWVTGGGQELVRTQDGEAMTRTYVGNTIPPEKLEVLGLTEKDVMIFLKRIITENGNEIRFDTNFERTEGDWNYHYSVTNKIDDPFIINGIEEIFFKGQRVFVHTFGISKAEI
jgi:hypothetical protein